ncbi:MAG: hypothetical protein DRN96_03220 [Thermoproteota archaeon]|nr:MAG: hypothetical protein DRN96_03220 [Candidatus Korarchaeota archaeon]
MQADLILYGGRVITPSGVAEALAVKGDRIAAVGSSGRVLRFAGLGTHLVDLGGAAVLPGFIDCHMHPLTEAMVDVNLTSARSLSEVYSMVRKAAREKARGEWVLGFGWSEAAIGGEPTRSELDEVSEGRPVLLARVCLHSAVANSRALELLKISRRTPVDEEKGVIIDYDSGVLKELAAEYALRYMLRQTPSEVKARRLQATLGKLASLGLATIVDAAAGIEELQAYRVLHKAGRLPVRVRVLLRALAVSTGRRSFTDPIRAVSLLDSLVDLKDVLVEDSWLRIQGIKLFLDGSLGARTAALEEEYRDKPGCRGELLHTPSELRELVSKAHSAGLQVCIHAIGDRAVKAALDALEDVARKECSKLRHRIEHCQVLSRELIARMRELGVIASIQLSFATSDREMAACRLSSRQLEHAYPWKLLLEAGVKCCGGSDYPIEDASPLTGVYNAAARPLPPEARGDWSWYLSQRISVRQAVDLLTASAAYAIHEENLMGSIEEGKYADLVALSENPLEASLEGLKRIKVLMTVVGGGIRHLQLRPQSRA